MTYELITHEDLQRFRMQLLVVRGSDANYVRRGAATVKQRVAEKFGGEEDVGNLSRHIAESASQEYSASP